MPFQTALQRLVLIDGSCVDGSEIQGCVLGGFAGGLAICTRYPWSCWMSFRANLSLLTVITSIKVRYRLGRRRGIWWQRAVAKVSRFVVWRCPHHGRPALAGCSRPRCRVTISLGPKAGGGPRRREQEEAVLVCGGPAAERHSGNGRWLRATRTTTTRLVQAC